ncbi:MAG: type II toxin-antitoxin system RelB/DinJ family antitoxin [Proteobacteria bacterium]|nr:type II toxin-antitoxin system RelB/DinJ family antitoxin [Pseudomonadota bacterium]
MTTVTVKKTTSVKLDEETKEEAKKVFKRLGLTMSEAFNLFLYQVKLNQGLPFEVRIPNKSTRKVLDDVRQGKNVEPLSLEDLKLP